MSYNCTIDLDKALDWQRSNAARMSSWLEKKQAWYQENHCDKWNDWVKDVFDLNNAIVFGLSLWSVILNEPLFGIT